MSKITASKVDLSFTTSTGYRSQCGYKSKGSEALVEAIDELARLLAIDGRSDDAINAAKRAVDRVKEHNK